MAIRRFLAPPVLLAPSPLHRALSRHLPGLVLSVTASALALGTWAEPAVAQSVGLRAYAIPPGDLEPALVRFAQESGVMLSYDTDLLAHRRTAGLNGAHDVRGGLSTLLIGTGLGAEARPSGGYRLQALPGTPGPVATLSTVLVQARRASDGTTEDARSYTSRVTSIASKSDQSFRDIPQSVSVVTRQQMDDRRIGDIREALAATPGLTVNKLNFNSSYVYSRGFQVDSMQVDGGAPINIADYTYAANQNMDFYDRVEVMRGASGLLGGVGDPGGIINIVRKKPLAESRLIVEQDVGSWKHFRTMVDATGPLTQGGRVRARGVVSYLNTDYFVDMNHQRSPQFYGVLEADLTPDTLVTAGLTRAQVRTRGAGGGEVPRYDDGTDIGLPRHTSFSQPWARGDQRTTEAFAELTHRFGNGWKFGLNAMRSVSDYDGTTAFAYGAVNRETGLGSYWYGGGRYDYKNTQTVVDAHLSGTFRLAGNVHDVLVGVDRQAIESHWNVGYSPSPTGVTPVDVHAPGFWQPEPAGPDSRRYNPWGQTQVGGYGMLRLRPVDRVQVIAGARVARYRFDQVYESRDEGGAWELVSGSGFKERTRITPYGGLIYDLNDDWSTYVSYASILKPQALRKAGPPPGTSLDPIEGNSVEAGLKGELLDGRVNATFSVFRVTRTGTAVVDSRYPTTKDEWSGNCCYLPQGKVTSRGVDLELGGEVLAGWQVSAGYTFTHTRDAQTDAAYSSITPRHLLKVASAYTLPGDLWRWKVGGSLHLQSSHYVSDTLYDAQWEPIRQYDFAQPGYAVWNAMLQYRVDPRWTISLNVNNIFDKTYYQTLGYASGGNYYGTPREFIVGVRGEF